MLDFIKETQDVWQRLQTAEKPVVLYGMGNGADKIIDWCEANGVAVAGIFASDGFVRGQTFRGRLVERYDDVRARLKDFLIVIAFASESPQVLEHFYFLSARHETAAPHLPLFAGDETVTFEWLRRHEDKLRLVYDKLADEQSRQVFAATLNYKLSGKIEYLKEVETERQHDLETLFTWHGSETYVDLGAYDGDTIREFLKLTGGRYRSIFALEPDRRNYKKLAAYAAQSGLQELHIFEKAVWKENAELDFSDSGGRQSSLRLNKKRPVQAAAIDSLLGEAQATYIKMDVEGAELEALEGGARQLARNCPKLFVAAYHRDEDIFLLPLYIWKLVPEYKIYLRKHPYIPAWELNFLAIR